MPPVETILVEEPQPEGPLGAKGVGEAVLVPTAAAVAEALYRFEGSVGRAFRCGIGGGSCGGPQAGAPGRRDPRPVRGRGRDRCGADPMTTVVAGGTVVVGLHPAEVVVGDVVIEGDRVVRSARRRADPRSTGAGRDVMDASGCLVIPGNVCAHTHAYSALARGMPYRLAPPRDFVEILRRVWWRLDRALDEAAIRASARVAAMEALLAGTTTLVDHHASPHAIDGSLDIIAEAFAEVGVRSILAYETTDRDGPGLALDGLAENRRFLARVADERPALVRGMVGAHASFTLSDATLEGCVDLARATGRGLHIHVAEDAADQRDSEVQHGLRVLDRLERAGALDPVPLIAHGVRLDHSEAALFRASGATLVHNPRSNMNNAVGRAPLGLLGPRVALGTDGIGADMFEESRVGYLRHVEERAGPGDELATGRGGGLRGPADAGSMDVRVAAGAHGGRRPIRRCGLRGACPRVDRRRGSRGPARAGCTAAHAGHGGHDRRSLDLRSVGPSGPRRHRRGAPRGARSAPDERGSG